MPVEPSVLIGPDRIWALGNAFRGAKTLLSAVELGVFTELAQGALDFDELRSKIDIAERGARDFFDALVALGVLDRDENSCYRNMPDTDLYLDRRKPTYIGGELKHFRLESADARAQDRKATERTKDGQLVPISVR